MATIKIGTIQSVKEPESFGGVPDDRQEIIKCINGVFVNDSGIFAEGEVINVSAVFSPESWATLKDYWLKRTRVDVTDHHGGFMASMRVVVKKYEYVKKHEFWQINFELWKI